jgi:hypothetical protein
MDLLLRLSPIAIGLAAGLPWLAFVAPEIAGSAGLQPAGCDPGDAACALTRVTGLAVAVPIATAGALYGAAAVSATGRGRRILAAPLTALTLLAGSFVAYAAVADNPIVAAIHGYVDVGLDELTPWVGIAEAFGIAVFVVSAVVVLAAAVAARARRVVGTALISAAASAAAFVAVVVVIDPVLGIRLGAETIGTRAMPWTGMLGNATAGMVGAAIGLRLLRRGRLESMGPEDAV